MPVNITVGSGLSSQLVVAAETTFGAAPVFTTPRTFEFKSETLALKKNTVQGQGLHGNSGVAGYLPLYDRTLRRVLSTYEASGDIIMDLPANQLGLLLQHMVGSFGQTLVGPTQIGGTSSLGYQQIHQPGSLQGFSFAVQKGVPATNGTVQPFTYVGCKIDTWQISVEVNKIAELKLTLDSRNELGGTGNSDPLNGAVPALATPNYTAGMQLFHFRQGTIYQGTGGTIAGGTASLVPAAGTATALGQVRKADVVHSVALDKARFFLGSGGFKAEQIEQGFRHISGNFDIEFQSSQAMYNAFAADNTIALELKFVGPLINGSVFQTLDILVPNVKLDGEAPKISGPQVVLQNIPFTGLDDTSTTPIQITYISTDTVL